MDSIRSIAILMVLEGHFITHSLQTKFRDDSNSIYAAWKFTRGLTAPLFLFISGLIFTYLLLKNKKQGYQNNRLTKGFKRGVSLICIGYLLQLNLYTFFTSSKPLVTDLFQIFHILQCIGASLLIIISLYLVKSYLLRIPLGIYTGLLSISIFLTTPTLLQLDYSGVPRFLENILIISANTNQKVSVFPLFPWAGFVLTGATLGTIFHQFPKLAHSLKLPIVLFIIGFVLDGFYYNILNFLWYLSANSGLSDFSDVYVFARLGQVLMILSSFIILHKYKAILAKPFQWVPWDKELFIKIGQNTLSIFVLHVVLLYQGFFGWNINQLISKKLTPWTAIFGAVLFIAFFVIYIKYLEQIQQFPNKLYRSIYCRYLKRKRSRFSQRSYGV
ncbi:heparan-alpha-glucosaminide N-acetyltransferase domain-containing protein [Wenyingzhuangia sp. 1_MG-2023]|nr:heparan-alpha-glucosaminide N-acetyltransferase domain-containing protein [Wenyingzhuangia sp. 1_MG-2023]